MKLRKAALPLVPLMTVLFIVMLIYSWSALTGKYQGFNKQIGEKQLELFKSYIEAEKSLFYIDQSAKQAAQLALSETILFIGEEPNCGIYGEYPVWFVAQNKQVRQCAFSRDEAQQFFIEEFKTQLDKFLLGYPQILPEINYEVSLSKFLDINGKATNKIIIPIGSNTFQVKQTLSEQQSFVSSYSLPPHFNIHIDYNFNDYDLLADKTKKIIDSCKEEKDKAMCVAQKKKDIFNDNTFQVLDQCESPEKEQFLQFIDYFESCFNSKDTTCICRDKAPTEGSFSVKKQGNDLLIQGKIKGKAFSHTLKDKTLIQDVEDISSSNFLHKTDSKIIASADTKQRNACTYKPESAFRICLKKPGTQLLAYDEEDKQTKYRDLIYKFAIKFEDIKDAVIDRTVLKDMQFAIDADCSSLEIARQFAGQLGSYAQVIDETSDKENEDSKKKCEAQADFLQYVKDGKTLYIIRFADDKTPVITVDVDNQQPYGISFIDIVRQLSGLEINTATADITSLTKVNALTIAMPFSTLAISDKEKIIQKLIDSFAYVKEQEIKLKPVVTASAPSAPSTGNGVLFIGDSHSTCRPLQTEIHNCLKSNGYAVRSYAIGGAIPSSYETGNFDALWKINGNTLCYVDEQGTSKRLTQSNVASGSYSITSLMQQENFKASTVVIELGDNLMGLVNLNDGDTQKIKSAFQPIINEIKKDSSRKCIIITNPLPPADNCKAPYDTNCYAKKKRITEILKSEFGSTCFIIDSMELMASQAKTVDGRMYLEIVNGYDGLHLDDDYSKKMGMAACTSLNKALPAVPADVKSKIRAIAKEKGVSDTLALALAQQESAFNHCCQKGATYCMASDICGTASPEKVNCNTFDSCGIVQINKKAHPQAFQAGSSALIAAGCTSSETVYDLECNLKYGLKFLSSLSATYANTDLYQNAVNKYCTNQQYNQKYLSYTNQWDRALRAYNGFGCGTGADPQYVDSIRIKESSYVVTS